MVASTDLCRIPKASGRGGWKLPKLSEAYTHFTGEELVDAHNAWEDLTAVQSVYWGIVDTQSKIFKEDLSPEDMYLSQRVPVVGSKIPDAYRRETLPEQELSPEDMYLHQRIPADYPKIPDVYRKDPLPEQE
jgi:hypothetical protein